jgi:hypothetical protein
MILRILLAFAILISACSSPDLPAAYAPYYPASDALENGVVYKFYVHGIPKEGFPFTDVRYDKLYLSKDGTMIVETFNPGFELTSRKKLQLNQDGIKLISEVHFNQGDTITPTISKTDYLIFDPARSATTQLTFAKPSTESTELTRTLKGDTLIAGNTGIIFSEHLRSTRLGGVDTIQSDASGNMVYMAGIGLLYGERHFDNITYKIELVEQMSGEDFEAKRKEPRHRVAYIDPDKTLDKKENFRLCHTDEKIVDYYNSGQGASHGNGKKEMVTDLLARIDKMKLFHESGYLTFRFVVSCEGKAGRFITEETDLNFDRKKFNPETVAHLYELVRNLQDWSPVVLDKPRDAYFYLTFKLSDGQITDILP